MVGRNPQKVMITTNIRESDFIMEVHTWIAKIKSRALLAHKPNQIRGEEIFATIDVTIPLWTSVLITE